MRAMVLTSIGPVEEGDRLELRELPDPVPGEGEVLIRVLACGICRTDLHLVEGELPDPKPNVVPGHQIAGVVEAVGRGVVGIEPGQRVGLPWLGGVCGRCPYCRGGLENLCDRPTFTGYLTDGGYAELVLARADFCFPLPDRYGDVEATPLLCAGLIGYRAYRLAQIRGLEGPARLGLWGFGNAAQILVQLAAHDGIEAYVYARGEQSLRLAWELGARWVGSGADRPPHPLDSVIVFAPVGSLVPHALEALRKGGSVVCAGIHMSPIPQFGYDLLWGERLVRSVANLTRGDGHDFLRLAAERPIRTLTRVFALEDANEALRMHKAGQLAGTGVLVP